MKVIEKVKETGKKVLYNATAVAAPVVCAASMALTASAEEAASGAASGSVDYSAATQALSSGFSDVASQIVTVAGVSIAAGIGIFGLKKLVTAAMGFFSKIVGR